MYVIVVVLMPVFIQMTVKKKSFSCMFCYGIGDKGQLIYYETTHSGKYVTVADIRHLNKQWQRSDTALTYQFP